MRLSEMTNEQLIRQVNDDALARELHSRLITADRKVADQVAALEDRILKLQGAA